MPVYRSTSSSSRAWRQWRAEDMGKRTLFWAIGACTLLIVGCQARPEADLSGQSTDAPAPWTDVHAVAWDIISSARVVTLITLNDEGQPQARLLDATPPDSGEFVIWMGTNRNSAKVAEISHNPRATLFYRSLDGGGYVTLRGTASIVDDAALKERYWRPAWEAFYPDRDALFVLIRFQPDDGEVVSFANGLVGDSLTWAAPEFTF